MPDHDTNAADLALGIADALIKVGESADSVAEGLSETTWKLAGLAARARRIAAGNGCAADRKVLAGADSYIPGHRTRSAVIAILRDREANTDPFAGFPT